MKRYILLIVLVFTGILTGCEIPEMSINTANNSLNCSSDEVLLNGVCVNVNNEIDIEYDDVFCADNEVVFGVCIDKTAPDFIGSDHIKIRKNAPFLPLSNITAIDDVDGDITDQITYEGVVQTSSYGKNIVEYRVTDAAGNETIFIRTIEVTYVQGAPRGPELALNGNFANGVDGWSFFNNSNGALATIFEEQGVLNVRIHSVPEESYFWVPRIQYQNLLFEQGKTYFISFDIWSDTERIFHLQVGDLISSDPWFTDFRPGADKLFYTATEKETFEFIFTMNHPTNDDGAILIELGNIYNYNTETTVYMDNLKVFELK